MKRLDKALEEAFEKEKQVKIETMSLMKRYGIKNENRHASYRNYKIGRGVIPSELEPVRLRKSTGPIETGISPVANFEKSSFLTLFLPIKTKMSHIFLFRVQKSAQNTCFSIICSEVF